MKKRSESVASCWEDFVLECKIKGLKKKTIEGYESHWRTLAPYIDGQQDIGELSKREIDTMIVALQEKGLKDTTIASYIRVLKCFISFCESEGLTELKIKPYKAQESLKETYTDAELKLLLKKPCMSSCAFTEYRTWVIINLLLNCGCRAATVRNIKVKDINFDNNTIAYRHTKNGSIQIVPLCYEMVRVLREYLRVRKSEGVYSDYLFVDVNGAQMSEHCLGQAVYKYNKRRGVEKTSIHLFRHSFAERYLQNGGNAFDLQRILGHTTLEMTKHYCRIYDNKLAANFNDFSPLAQLGARKVAN